MMDWWCPVCDSPLHWSGCEPGGRFHSPGPRRTVGRWGLSLLAPQPTAPSQHRAAHGHTEFSITFIKIQFTAAECECVWERVRERDTCSRHENTDRSTRSHSNWLTHLWLLGPATTCVRWQWFSPTHKHIWTHSSPFAVRCKKTYEQPWMWSSAFFFYTHISIFKTHIKPINHSLNSPGDM